MKILLTILFLALAAHHRFVVLSGDSSDWVPFSDQSLLSLFVFVKTGKRYILSHLIIVFRSVLWSYCRLCVPDDILLDP